MNDTLWRYGIVTLKKNERMMQNQIPKSNISNDSLFSNTASKAALSDILRDRSNNINEFNLYLAHFNYIPNATHEINIDCKRAHDWFLGEFEKEIKNSYFIKRYFNQSKSAQYDDIFYFIDEDLIVDFDTQQSIVRFLFRKTGLDRVETISRSIRKFKKRKQQSRPELQILVRTMNGIETKDLEITRQKVSISENYNDDFIEVHQTILKRLTRKNDKGIVLLHGKPGTDKTSYIRHIISTVKKDVIFLPPNMATSITNPDLISILLDNPNSVFVIEDAENIVVDREREGNSPVSALLNISDGLLSDCLNIQIICSFNTDLSKVDSALMRKGRLIAKYEFKELEVDKAAKLSKKLGFSTEVESPMTLTAIYNQEEKEFQQRKKHNPIGFRTISENRLAEN